MCKHSSIYRIENIEAGGDDVCPLCVAENGCKAKVISDIVTRTVVVEIEDAYNDCEFLDTASAHVGAGWIVKDYEYESYDRMIVTFETAKDDRDISEWDNPVAYKCNGVY